MDNTLKIAFLLLIPAMSLLFEGIKRKLIARFQNRIGPPIVQPFYDIVKLWSKKESSSIGYKNPIFRVAPLFFFVAVWALFLFVPFAVIHFEFDFIFLIYLTVFNSALFTLVAIVSNSPFSTVGAMRECVLMVIYEIMFAVAILSFFVYSGATSFAGYTESFAFIHLPIATFCLFCVALIELKITPFDTIEASSEIYTGPLTEFSGKELALLHLGEWMKLAFFIFLIPTLAIGVANVVHFAIACVLLLFVFPLCKATTNRYRLDQAFSTFIAIFVLCLLNFVYVILIR